MRVVVDALTILLALLGHVLLSRHIPELGRHVDLFLCLTVQAGILRGRTVGMAMGVAAGLVQDQFFGTLIGMNAFAKALVGYGTGALASRFLLEGTAWRVAILVAGTVLDRSVRVGLAMLLRQAVGAVDPVDWMQMAVLNAVAGLGVLQLAERRSRESG